MDEIRAYLGEIIPGGIVLVSYGQYSLGWKIGVNFLKQELENGGFGIIANFTVPFRKLVYRAGAVGLNLLEHGDKGSIAVINGFKEPLVNHTFVYPFVEFDEETFSPKYKNIMRNLGRKYNFRDKRVVAMFATLDALYEHFGGNFIKNMISMYMSHTEKLIQEGREFYTIMLVNRDVIPEGLHSWLVGVSDYVILSKGFFEKGEFYENIVILKSIEHGFNPIVFQIKALTIPKTLR
ncbi:hypothetical protein K1720_06905 [Thermococcus argininiproducens]|uniref:KaiC-like domain-containing protein n=1 Tax=Thermococcus argininiproducens TaxID=2866384 RepID=A0A9E7M924_9EURY|nr:hypothetical protein [Thermococcus argininiproducens]USG99268.1 hypothetical protein K1720_06905 [Thermococcus argininiproducens]